MESLKGAVALVTGAGSGLGAATCHMLSEAGARTIVADVGGAAAEQTAASIVEGGGYARAVAMDVTDQEQVERGIRQAVEAYGRLDVLINNAGIDHTVSIEEMDIESWDRVMAVNLRGPFLTTKEAFQVMGRQGGGRIINIVSTAALRAWANASAYHASKWGLRGFSHAMHVEGRLRNIQVTAVICGGMRTPFLLDRFPGIDTDVLQDPANVAKTIQFVLTQPAGTVIPEVMVLPANETSWP
ncbi:MAG: SDR family oxidoreductase [Dehalococcoidia bacterium]